MRLLPTRAEKQLCTEHIFLPLEQKYSTPDVPWWTSVWLWKAHGLSELHLAHESMCTYIMSSGRKSVFGWHSPQNGNLWTVHCYLLCKAQYGCAAFHRAALEKGVAALAVCRLREGTNECVVPFPGDKLNPLLRYNQTVMLQQSWYIPFMLWITEQLLPANLSWANTVRLAPNLIVMAFKVIAVSARKWNRFVHSKLPCLPSWMNKLS